MADSSARAAKPRQNRAAILSVAIAGAISLSVGMGMGRFAFTPILPMMLHDGVIDLRSGSWLATANYAGYLAGAMACTILPRAWPASLLVKLGLGATVVLTLGMGWHVPALWPLLRFLAGVASAAVFVYTSEWCLRRLASLDAPEMGAVIYTGPGAGIALSGFVATATVAAHRSSAFAWLAFGLLAALLSAAVWTVFRGPNQLQPAPGRPPSRPFRPEAHGSAAEMATFTAAYGLAGFGYIITATFLPVIARESLPASLWLDLFWPIFGLAAVAGCLLSARVPRSVDPRLTLAACYILQAIGVVIGLFVPTLAGFVAGSVLVGMPFTAVAFFAMQEVRRLRPHQAARFMGLLTAVYGIGQIAGPALVGFLLAHTASHARGFAISLWTACAALLLGAGLYVLMRQTWSFRRPARTL